MNQKDNSVECLQERKLLGVHLEQRNYQLSKLYEINNRLETFANRIGFSVNERPIPSDSTDPAAYLELNQINMDNIDYILERIDNTLSSIERL